MHTWHKYLRRNLLNSRRKNQSCEPTGQYNFHYEQSGYKIFSRDIVQHTSTHCQPRETTITRNNITKDINFSSPPLNRVSALEQLIQATPNLLEKQTYVFPNCAPSLSLVVVCLLKLCAYQNCYVLKLQQYELEKPSGLTMLKTTS